MHPLRFYQLGGLVYVVARIGYSIQTIKKKKKTITSKSAVFGHNFSQYQES